MILFYSALSKRHTFFASLVSKFRITFFEIQYFLWHSKLPIIRDQNSDTENKGHAYYVLFHELSVVLLQYIYWLKPSIFNNKEHTLGRTISISPLGYGIDWPPTPLTKKKLYLRKNREATFEAADSNLTRFPKLLNYCSFKVNVKPHSHRKN